jgi:carbon storage regulator
MIVLSRRKGESLVINNDISVVVIEIRGDVVRLGIESPKEVPVHRGEVYEALRRVSDAPQPAVEPPAPRTTTITLSARHAELIDRLRAATALSRAEAIEAVLDQIEQSGAQSLQELREVSRR